MNVQASIVHERVGEPRRYALRVEDFLALQESGVFDGFARAELIEGEIYTVNAIHRPHAGALSQVNAELVFALRALGLPLTVYSPVSARLDDNSMPEPDLVIATIEPEDTVSARSIRLAVEVASSSLVYDLGKKGPLYAAAGIPEYWIVDLTGRKIIRMSDCGDDDRKPGNPHVLARLTPVESGSTRTVFRNSGLRRRLCARRYCAWRESTR